MPTLPVLFLPGTLCTAAVFSHQLESLDRHCGEILLARFETERSLEEMAESAARLIPDGRRVAVAGFSMGGMVALTLAERYPERVDRIALLNSNCHPDLPERQSGRKKYIAEAQRTSLRAVLESGFLKNYLHRQEAEHRELILDMAEDLGLACFDAQSEALARRGEQSAVLSGLDIPVLILGSRQDVLCPPAVQRDMHGRCKHSRLVMIEKCGHFAVLERPEEVNRALLEWLQA